VKVTQNTASHEITGTLLNLKGCETWTEKEIRDYWSKIFAFSFARWGWTHPNGFYHATTHTMG